MSLAKHMLNATWPTQQKLGTPRILQRGLAHKCATRHERLVIEDLDYVRDYGNWLKPQQIELSGAFQTRNQMEAPHSFCYKPRASQVLRMCIVENIVHQTKSSLECMSFLVEGFKPAISAHVAAPNTMG